MTRVRLYFKVAAKSYDKSIASTPFTTDKTTIDFGIFSSTDFYLDYGIKGGSVAFSLYTRETSADSSSGIDLEFFINFNSFNLDDLINAGFDPKIANLIYNNLSSLKIRSDFLHSLVDVGQTVYSAGSISSVGSSNLQNLNNAVIFLNQTIYLSATKNPDGTLLIILSLSLQ